MFRDNNGLMKVRHLRQVCRPFQGGVAQGSSRLGETKLKEMY